MDSQSLEQVSHALEMMFWLGFASGVLILPFLWILFGGLYRSLYERAS